MESISSAASHTLPTNSLDRGLAVMELLVAHPRGLTHTEIARFLGVPSSTCSYITRKLMAGGYLRREPASGRFRLGLKTVSLAHGALHGLGFRSISEPVLYRLTEETGLSAGIGVLHGATVLVVDRVDGQDVLAGIMGGAKRHSRARENRDIGRELPLHSSALGKVLLAYLDKADFEERAVELTAGLRKQLNGVRKQGYATAQELYVSIRALAVPIVDPAGRARAALSLNGDSSAAVWADMPALLSQVQVAAAEIARQSRYLWIQD
ncbi:MAG: IclR family transcriptional regulator [Acidobacteriota bacterium]